MSRAIELQRENAPAEAGALSKLNCTATSRRLGTYAIAIPGLGAS